MNGPAPSPRQFFLAALACVALASHARAQSVRLEHIRVGFPHAQADRYKVGYWAAIRFDVVRDGGSDVFAGNVVAETEDSDGVTARFAPIPVTLSAGQKQTSGMTYLKIGGMENRIRLRMDGQLGAASVREQASYDPKAQTAPLPPGKRLVLCLGQPAGFDQLDPHETGDAHWRVAFQADPAQLPEHWIGYESVDAVVISSAGASFRTLLDKAHAARLRALRDWVGMGGHLVVSVAENYQLVGDSKSFPLEPLLPRRIDTAVVPENRLLDGVASRVRVDVQGSAEDAFSAPLTRLEPRPFDLGRVWARQSAPETAPPAVVQTPHGLGLVTLIAFDTDEGGFTFWEGRHSFWIALLELQPPAPSSQPQFQARFARATPDLATQLAGRLERFDDVPTVSFGWIALMILGYLLIVGPLDYFFLRRFVKRPEATWLTLPVLVLLGSAGIFWLNSSLKGSEPRVNKIDVIDIDLSQTPARAYGTSWVTLFTPERQQYEVGLVPTGPGCTPEGSVVTWLGRPGSGMRGLQYSRPPGVMDASLQSYGHTLEDGIIRLSGVPVADWGARSFSGRWQATLDSAAILAHDLETKDLHGATLTWTFPQPLQRCQLLYNRGHHDPHGWDLGTLQPGQVIRVADLGNSFALDKLHAGKGESNAPQEGAKEADGRDEFALVREILFHDSADATGTAPSDYLKSINQSWRLRDFRTHAVLIGLLENTEGPAAEMNARVTLGTRLEPFRPELAGRLRQWTIVRLYLPLRLSRDR